MTKKVQLYQNLKTNKINKILMFQFRSTVLPADFLTRLNHVFSGNFIKQNHSKTLQLSKLSSNFLSDLGYDQEHIDS